MRRRGAYHDVLEVREARALIGASAASQVGDWLYNTALLSYVYVATGSAWWVGAATIFRLLPYVLLGPVGGSIADRYRRRTVLISGDLLRLALMLALGAVVASDGPVEVVIALTALASAAGTAERPAAIAMLPRLVGETRLGAANALLHTVQDLGVVVGPAIAAVLLTVGPHWLAFVANAATFAISATLIATIRDRSRPAGRATARRCTPLTASAPRDDSVLRPANRRRQHGGADLRRADGPARPLRARPAWPGRRRIRRAARGLRRRRRAQRPGERSADNGPPDRLCGRRGVCGHVRHAVCVRGEQRRGGRHRRDRGRWCRAGGVRGDRRDGAHPNRAGGPARAADRRLRLGDGRRDDRRRRCWRRRSCRRRRSAPASSSSARRRSA